jgi:hypothetical protein
MKKIKIFGSPNCKKCMEMESEIAILMTTQGVKGELYDVETFPEVFIQEGIKEEDYPTFKFYNEDVCYRTVSGVLELEYLIEILNETN